MKITASRRSDDLVFDIEGAIDSRTSADVQDAVLPAFSSGPRRVAIDMRRVTYVSSAGLRIVLVLAKKAHGMGIPFVLFGPSNPVREVFEISGFTRIVSIVETEAEAFAGQDGR